MHDMATANPSISAAAASPKAPTKAGEFVAAPTTRAVKIGKTKRAKSENKCAR